MKSFAIVAVLFAVFLQAEGQSIKGTNLEVGSFIHDELQQRFRCAKKLGSERVTQLPQINQMEQLPENNTVLNEYLECLWKEKGIISENALLNEDTLEKYYIVLLPNFRIAGRRGRKAAHDMVQKCKSVLGNDFGQRAVKIQNCITKSVREKTS